MESIIAQVREGNTNEVREWIENCENDLDIGDDHSFSLLHWAAREGKFDIVELLLKEGARPNITNAGYDTPLHLAAAHGHYKVVELLHKCCPSLIYLGNEYGNTPLHYACFWGHKDIAIYLFENGASPHQENDDGRSPLHVTPENVRESFRNVLQPGGDVKPYYSLESRNFQAEELRAKNAALLREEIQWDAKYIETNKANWEDKHSQYHHGTYNKDRILIKIIEPNVTSLRIERDIREEASRLRIFNHKNILPLLGYITKKKICFFTEHVSFGPLFYVLHDPAISHNITRRQGLKFALGIANGMSFLHKPEFNVPFYRLNSKNVMVCDDLCRIFLHDNEVFNTQPMERHLYDSEYLMARLNMVECNISSLFKAREYNPAWMSPEALKNKPNTINLQASDVWSFGVVLWEIHVRKIPFENLEPMVVGIQIATESLRLPLIADDDRINRLFKLCTNNEPKNRPRFGMLSPILDKMLERERIPYN